MMPQPSPAPYIPGRNTNFTYGSSPQPIPPTPRSVAAQSSANPSDEENWYLDMDLDLFM